MLNSGQHIPKCTPDHSSQSSQCMHQANQWYIGRSNRRQHLQLHTDTHRIVQARLKAMCHIQHTQPLTRCGYMRNLFSGRSCCEGRKCEKVMTSWATPDNTNTRNMQLSVYNEIRDGCAKRSQGLVRTQRQGFLLLHDIVYACAPEYDDAPDDMCILESA